MEKMLQDRVAIITGSGRGIGKEVALGIPAAARDAMKMMIPMGRPGTVEEAAGPILFLASPLSDHVSGQCIEITGGL